jgi:DNA-binding response OmpR family regulator
MLMEYARHDGCGPDEGRRAPRVLIVEPDREQLGAISRRIAEAGYRVVTAETVGAALAELNRASIDLVLAELSISGPDEVELVRMIREDPMQRELPILLLADGTDAESVVHAYRCGADMVISKPFHMEVLIARIAREMERSQALQKLRSDNAALDERIVGRTIELGEMREWLSASEAERQRLQALIKPNVPPLDGGQSDLSV